MRKLLFTSVLLLAFACSKEDEQKDVDPIVGKWTSTKVIANFGTFFNKFDVKADGTMVKEHWRATGKYGMGPEEKVGESLFVWKNLQTEKTERMLYKFSYCGYRGHGDAEWNRCDEIADDFELLTWSYDDEGNLNPNHSMLYIIYKWDITFNEDFSDGSGTGYWRANVGDDEITEYWGDLSKD